MPVTVRRAGTLPLLTVLVTVAACSRRGCGAGAADKPSTAPGANGASPPPGGSPSSPAIDENALADATALITKVAAAPEPTTYDVDRTAATAGDDPAKLFALV